MAEVPGAPKTIPTSPQTNGHGVTGKLRFDPTLNWNTLVLLIGFLGTGFTAYFTLKSSDLLIDQRLVSMSADLARTNAAVDQQRNSTNAQLDLLRQQLQTQIADEARRAHERMTQMERRTENSSARVDAELIRLRDKIDGKADRVK